MKSFCSRIFLPCSLLLVALAHRATAATNEVPRWGRFEESFTNANPYADSYRDVTLNVTYTKPDASTVNFWGFYDSSNTWRIRFMPDQVGTWSYAASFSDGTPAESNSFECVAGDLPGLIGVDESNPQWFGFKGGTHALIRSFHVGDRFSASNWPATNRTAFLDWSQAQGYNMLAIASLFLNRNEAGRGAGWNTPDLWDGPTRALRAGEYRELEAILDDLAARRMIVFPFSGFFGKSSDFPTNHADQELYLRYTLARVGTYWNMIYNVAGPEPLLPGDEYKYQNAMGTNDIRRLANLIKTLDPFGHLVSEHNITDADAFASEAWEDYKTLQGPKTTNRFTLSAGVLARHQNKPCFALELLWPGNNQGHPVYTDTDIRKNGFVLMMSAAALNFGDMNGNSSSGFTGSMDFADKIQSRHDIIKKVWDFFGTEPFWRMKPRQDLVTTNAWCLADPGREYLAYLQRTGTVSIAVSNGPFHLEWINAQNTADRRAGPMTTNGLGLVSPADGDDWLVHLEVPVEAWRSAYFTNATQQQAALPDDADPDGDGVKNLAEYFFATDPTVPDTGKNLPSIIQTNDTLQFRYVRRQGALPLSITTEFSSDLEHWSAGVLGIDYDAPLIVPDTNGTETVSVHLLNAGPAHFVRAVTAIQADPLEVWRAAHFATNLGNPAISGNAADPDSDGMNNLAEFYFAGDPNQPDSTNGHLPAIALNGTGPRVQFIRRHDPGNVILGVEFSTDLAHWNSGTQGVDYDTFSAISNGDGTETITLQFRAEDSSRFGRFRLLAP